MVWCVGILCFCNYLNWKWVIVVRVICMWVIFRILILIFIFVWNMVMKLIVCIVRIMCWSGMVVGIMVWLLVIGCSMNIFVICVFWKVWWVVLKGNLMKKWYRILLILILMMWCCIVKLICWLIFLLIRCWCWVWSGISNGWRI